ncbi:MAG: methyltransferase domain-containing protein [Dehalococcoidia bacterium]
MRKNTRALAAIVARCFDLPEPVVEFGAYQVTGARYEDLRPLFAGKHYLGCDVRPGPGVDRVEDLHALTFADATVGTAVLLDTLEHVQDPTRAMAEVQRVLKPGGIAVATSVMDLFIHCRPDYWRFTPEAMKHLFDAFGQTLVGFQGNPEKPHTVLAVGVKEPEHSYVREFAAVEQMYRRANRGWYWRVAQPYYVARDALHVLRHNNAFGFEVVEEKKAA